MSKIGLFLFAAVLAMSANTVMSAGIDACQAPERAPSVAMTLDEGPVRVHRVSKNELRARAGGLTATGLTLRGLTNADTHEDISVEFSILPTSGGICMTPRNIAIRFGLRQDVYIDAEYPEKSCQHSVILRHEQQHVAINRAFLARAGEIKTAVARAAARTFPIYTGNIQSGQAIAMADLNQAMRNAIADIQRDTVRENAAIDTVDAYQANSRQCPSW